MTFCESSGRGGLGPSAAVPLALRVNATCSIPSCPMKTISECSAFCSAVKTRQADTIASRSEEHTSELQSLMRISYAVFCLKKKKQKKANHYTLAYNQQTKIINLN